MNNQTDKSTSFRSYQDRHKSHLTPQQVTYLTARINGKTKTEAKRLAKYSENTSTSLIENNQNMRAALLECMRNNGMNEQFIVDKLAQGLQAKKTIYATKDGVISDTREIDDNETQHKYFRDTLEIRGDIKVNAIDQVNIGLINVSSEKEDNEWNNPSTLDGKSESIDKSIEQK